MKTLFQKFYTLCLIAISYALAVPAFIGSTQHVAASNFPVGSNASFQRSLYKELSGNKEFSNLKKQMGFGYLRAEAVLTNSQGVYNFNIKRTGTEVITERKLDLNDSFVVTSIAVLIASMDSTKPGQAVPQSYPNGTVFAQAQSVDLETLYNGYLTIKTNQLTNPEAIPMDIFRTVPTTQQSAVTNRSQGAAVSAAAFLGQLPILRGNQSIDISITAPVFTGLAWANIVAGTDNKLILKMYGYLVKGAAAAVTANDMSV